MNKQIRWIIVGLLLLSLSSMACALSGGNDGETAVLETAVSETAVESITAAEEAVTGAIEEAGGADAVAEAAETVAEPATNGETINVAELGQALNISSILDGQAVQSYQYDLLMNLSGDGGSGETLITILYNADPPATSIVMSMSGEAFAEDAQMGNVHMSQIGDTVYMDVPEMGCMQMPATDSSMTGEMMGGILGNDIVENLKTIVKVGNETVNGVETTHYTFDETAYIDIEGGMDTVDGHIYVAKDGGYMVRMIIDGTGDVGDFSGSGGATQGTLHIEMNLTHINEPAQIEAPADCQSFDGGFGPNTGDTNSGKADEYPVTDDAAAVFAMEGMTTYTTAMPVSDVMVFYQERMAERGWVENEAVRMIDAGRSSTTAFTKDGKTMTVIINNESDGVTAVTILVME